jgi:hypothetical protein
MLTVTSQNTVISVNCCRSILFQLFCLQSRSHLNQPAGRIIILSQTTLLSSYLFSPVCLFKFNTPLPTGWDSVVGTAIRYGLDDRGSNPGQGEIFRTSPDRPWVLPSLLYNAYKVSFPGVKRPGRGVYHPHSSSAEVKERVELYLYSPSGPSWTVVRRTLSFYLLQRRALDIQHLY